MATDFTQDPIARRWIVRGLLVIVAVIALFSGWLHFSMARYEGNFIGMREEAVLARLGQPYYDERERRQVRTPEYTLGWSYSFGLRLILKLKDGVVVSQDRGSR